MDNEISTFVEPLFELDKTPSQALWLGWEIAYCACAAGDFSNVSSM